MKATASVWGTPVDWRWVTETSEKLSGLSGSLNKLPTPWLRALALTSPALPRPVVAPEPQTIATSSTVFSCSK